MTIFTGGPVTQSKTLLSDYAVTTGEALSAYEDDALRFSPLPSIIRGVEQFSAQRDETSPILTTDDQDKRIAEAQVKLKSKNGMRESTLNLLIERKQDEAKEQNAIARASGWQSAGGIAAGFVVSAFDPLNIATAYIPVAGPAMYATSLAKQSTRLGRLGTRVGFGASQGLVGAAAVEPIVAMQASNEQADYTTTDILMNLAFGTVLGGGLHGAIGAAGDTITAGRQRQATELLSAQHKAASDEAFANLTPLQREELIRTNLASAFEDRNITATPALFKQDLRSSTAIGRVGATEGARFDVTSATFQKQLPPDVDAEARNLAPELMDEYDRLRAEVAEERRRLGELSSDGRVYIETVAEAKTLDEIAVVEAKMENASAKNKKKLQKQIDAIREKAEIAKAEARTAETPAMRVTREALEAADNELRDLAPEISRVLRQAEATAKGQPVSFGPEQTRFNISPRQPEPNPFPDMAHQARSPQNIRTTNFAELDRRTKEFSAQDDRMDMVGAQAETAEIMEDIQRFTIETNDPELKAALDKIVSDEAENVKLAEGYQDGILAAFHCRIK